MSKKSLEPSLNFLEHIMPLEIKSPDGSVVDDTKIVAGQVWVKPRANSSSMVCGKQAPPRDRLQRAMSRTLPSNEDQLTFKEMRQGSILIDKNKNEKSGSKRVAKEAAQIINGFSSLKNQIEELKTLFIQLKKENNDTKKFTVLKGKLKKQGSNHDSQKLILQNTQVSPTKKKYNEDSLKASVKALQKRSASNSKRSISQKNTFRSSLFGRGNLNGSLEAIDKNTLFSSDKQTVLKAKNNGDRFKNLYTGAIYGKVPETDRKSVKNSLRKSSSKNSGLKPNSIFGKNVDPTGHYFDSILGSLSKPAAVKSTKRTADVLSLVNINNLYATVAHDSGLKKKIRKKFSTPNKSHDKEFTSAKRMLENAVKPRDSFEEFRHTYSTARIRPKKPLIRDSSKKNTEKAPKYIQDISTYYTRTERGGVTTRQATDRVISREKTSVIS